MLCNTGVYTAFYLIFAFAKKNVEFQLKRNARENEMNETQRKMLHLNNKANKLMKFN